MKKNDSDIIFYLQSYFIVIYFIEKSLSSTEIPSRFFKQGSVLAGIFACKNFFCAEKYEKGFIVEQKAVLLDENAVIRSLVRISHEITERNKGAEELLILGILRRGASLAEMICSNIKRSDGSSVEYSTLDITYYRDDLTKIGDVPVINRTPSFDVKNKTVILVDDVIFTGRTVRAAIEAVFAAGRPRAIQLAVLIDRGHRELPIRPDYVGKNVPSSLSENIRVCVPEYDGKTGAFLCG